MTPNGTRLLLLIDNDPVQRRLICATASKLNWRMIHVCDPETAIATLGTQDGMMLDAIVLDRTTLGTHPAALIQELHARRPALPIIFITHDQNISTAIEAIHAGANDFLAKPITPDRLTTALHAIAHGDRYKDELRPFSEKLLHLVGYDEIIGSNSDFRSALAIAAKSARSRTPILIEGEDGVGKHIIADAIHRATPRVRKPMTIVNCASFTPTMLASELFGHERGSFTGAFERHIGKIQEADGGTLLLDEIDLLPLDAQMQLIRVLQSGEIQPIGSRSVINVDVRIIATTSKNLMDLMITGRFREELYYRINTIPVRIPALRDRKGDIPALARHLLGRIAQQTTIPPLVITQDAMAILLQYDWPGNVRQLHDCLFRAAIWCGAAMLDTQDFAQIAEHIANPDHGTDITCLTRTPRTPKRMTDAAGVTLYQPDGNIRLLDDIEADIIRLAIGHYRGRMSEVARRLGIGRSTLYRKLSELGINEAA